MAEQHKILQAVGLAALCDQIKGIKATSDAAGEATVQIAEALESLSTEVEGLINDLDTELDDLTAMIVAGEVSTPMATHGKESLATQGGVEIYAYRILAEGGA